MGTGIYLYAANQMNFMTNSIKSLALGAAMVTMAATATAQDIKGLVKWSGGLYDPPPQFVDW